MKKSIKKTNVVGSKKTPNLSPMFQFSINLDFK